MSAETKTDDDVLDGMTGVVCGRGWYAAKCYLYGTRLYCEMDGVHLPTEADATADIPRLKSLAERLGRVRWSE